MRDPPASPNKKKMKGYWKIAKEWISDWGLNASECIVLADILSGWECTVKERAQRCGMSVRSLERAFANIVRNESAKMALKQVPKWHFKGAKLALTKCQSGTSEVPKWHFPPHPLIIEEEKKNIEERENNSHPLESNSMLEKIEKVAAEFREELASETQTAERFLRLFGLPKEQLLAAADIFRDTLLAQGDEYKSRGDYRRHFLSWLKINAKRIFNEPTQSKNARDNADYINSLLNELRSSTAG